MSSKTLKNTLIILKELSRNCADYMQELSFDEQQGFRMLWAQLADDLAENDSIDLTSRINQIILSFKSLRSEFLPSTPFDSGQVRFNPEDFSEDEQPVSPDQIVFISNQVKEVMVEIDKTLVSR